jgi:hypothetical protein
MWVWRYVVRVAREEAGVGRVEEEAGGGGIVGGRIGWWGEEGMVGRREKRCERMEGRSGGESSIL